MPDAGLADFGLGKIVGKQSGDGNFLLYHKRRPGSAEGGHEAW